jgi:hypothetical protein
MGPTVAAILVVISALIGGIAFANFILPYQFSVGERQSLQPQGQPFTAAPLTDAHRLQEFRRQMDEVTRHPQVPARSAPDALTRAVDHIRPRHQRPDTIAVSVRPSRQRPEPLSESQDLTQRLPTPRESLSQGLDRSMGALQDDWRLR